MSLFTWPAWSVHSSIIVLETSPCNLLTVEASSFTIAGREGFSSVIIPQYYRCSMAMGLTHVERLAGAAK